MKMCKFLAVAAIMAVTAGSQSAMAQVSGTSEFTVSATLTDVLIIRCDKNVLSFGTIGRASNYIGGGELVIGTTSQTIAAATTDNDLILSGSSAPIECAVSGYSADATGSQPAFDRDDVTLFGLADDTKTLSVRLGSGGAGMNGTDGEKFYIGGDLTIPSGETAPADIYTSEPVTVTVTESL